MKYLKPFFASLAVVFSLSNIAHADAVNSHDMINNKIPESIIFYLKQPGGNHAALFIHHSNQPAKILCYFTSNSNQLYKGVSARFTSTTSKLDFMNNSNVLMAGKTDVDMFTVTQPSGNNKMSRVDITLEGNFSTLQTIAMFCTRSQ